MNDVELSKKLREISRSTASVYNKQIFKQAAQRIDKLSEELERTKDLLAAAVADLRKADDVCCYCAHREPPAPCFEDSEIYECEKCPRECYCKDCIDNSKWEYHGLIGTVGHGLSITPTPDCSAATPSGEGVVGERIPLQTRNDKEEGSMHLCKDCDHLMVCKYTDAGDGRCQKPQYFRDKQAAVPE